MTAIHDRCPNCVKGTLHLITADYSESGKDELVCSRCGYSERYEEEKMNPTENKKRFISIHELNQAVNASCTCGGYGPGEGCPACEVWHRLTNDYYPERKGTSAGAVEGVK